MLYDKDKLTSIGIMGMAEKQDNQRVQVKNGVEYPADGTVVTSSKKRLSLFGRTKNRNLATNADSTVSVLASKNKKRAVLIVGTLVIVLLASAGGFAWWHYNQSDESNKKITTTTKEEPARDDYVGLSSNPEKGSLGKQSDVDARIASAKSDQERGELYLEKFYIGVTDAEPEKTRMEYLMQAEMFKPTALTAKLLAENEEFNKSGSTENAIKYYKLYLARSATSAEPLTEAAKDFYQKTITRLESEL